MLKQIVVAFACSLSPLWGSGVVRSAEPVDFSRQVLPILAANCFACHGPDAEQRQGDLRLDEEQAAVEHVIVPGDPAASELIARITSSDDEQRMPPPEMQRQLTAADIELLTAWIEQGAGWGRHWAFEPPRRPSLPEPPAGATVINPIDHFVLAELTAQGLTPAESATRRAWLRRVSFDLTGLPPTPAELAAFEADDSPLAYETQVDRLLASPHFGERMAVAWLDIARYADTNGYQNDFNRSMWPWRDWVIGAFNANLPADDFLTWQLAGDLLPSPTQEQLVATGFNRNHRMVTEGGSIDEEWRVENVVDRVETTATAFLGLTLGCARCHDHKYDPISRRDFYAFYAFFNNVDEQGVYTERRGNVPPLIEVPTPQQREQLADLDARIAAAREELEQAEVDVAGFLSRDSEQDSESGQLPLPRLHAVADGELLLATEGGDEQRPLQDPRFLAGAPMWQEGPSGSGVVFTGSEDAVLELGQAFAAARETPASWTLWARVEKPGALLSKIDDAAAYRGFDTILLDDMRLKVHLISSWPQDAIAVTSKTPVPRDAWFHLAVSYDGSGQAEGLQLWLDGTPLETNLEQNTLRGPLETEQPLRVGRRSTGLSLQGAVADLQFFDHVLSSSLVRRLRGRDLAERIAEAAGDANALSDATVRYIRGQQSHGLQAAIAELEKERDAAAKSVQTTMVMRDRTERRPTYMLTRGQYDQPETDESLEPQLPAHFSLRAHDRPADRRDLAEWLVGSENPLTARVMVNRLWQQMFGRGLVATVDNFGLQGEPPSHPALLDWLALEFVESGWDTKAALRQIALSATYRQSASSSPEQRERDPENRWLARGPRRRLSAEMIRDNALTVAGLLSEKIGGPPVKPYQPAGLWDELAGGANGGPYVLAEGEDLYRRSLYTFRKRTVSHPTLATFDAPSWEICQATRGTTNTPLQSLALLNDTTYAEAAAHLAVRMHEAAADEIAQGVTFGFTLATSRMPRETELQTLLAGYDQYLTYYRGHEAEAAALLSHGGSPIGEERRSPELAALAAVATVMLNLDEAVSR